MLVFRFFRIPIRIDFGFFATVGFMLLTSDESLVLTVLLVCLLHEIGHLSVMAAFGIPLKRIEFHGAGIKIVPENKALPFRQELFLLCGGCAVNLILFAATVFCNSRNVLEFSAINLILLCFNLIPAEFFDGGRILLLISEGTAAERGVYIFVKYIAPITVAVFAVWLFFYFDVGITAVITLFYFLMASFIREFS